MGGCDPIRVLTLGVTRKHVLPPNAGCRVYSGQL